MRKESHKRIRMSQITRCTKSPEAGGQVKARLQFAIFLKQHLGSACEGGESHGAKLQVAGDNYISGIFKGGNDRLGKASTLVASAVQIHNTPAVSFTLRETEQSGFIGLR